LGGKDRDAIKGRVIRDDRLFGGLKGQPERIRLMPLERRDVAGMWRRNAAITMRYALMHGHLSASEILGNCPDQPF
jgi:hypothetical protein